MDKTIQLYNTLNKIPWKAQSISCLQSCQPDYSLANLIKVMYTPFMASDYIHLQEGIHSISPPLKCQDINLHALFSMCLRYDVVCAELVYTLYRINILCTELVYTLYIISTNYVHNFTGLIIS